MIDTTDSMCSILPTVASVFEIATLQSAALIVACFGCFNLLEEVPDPLYLIEEDSWKGTYVKRVKQP